MLETGTPPNAKEEHLSQALTCQGGREILQALKVGIAFDGYMEK